jgi:hypothetical protein
MTPMTEAEEMEALYRDLREVAAWLDHLHPETASHAITPLFNSNRDRSTDIARISIDYLGTRKSRQSLNKSEKNLVRKTEDKVQLHAKVAIRALGYRIVTTGKFYIPYAGTFSAEDLSAHQRIEAIRHIDDARFSSYARVVNDMKSFE